MGSILILEIGIKTGANRSTTARAHMVSLYSFTNTRRIFA